jgi:uncharacterized membrane protein
MDILSFILGISVVVVIAVAIVAVTAFVKVRKQEKEIENIQRDISQNISDIYRNMSQQDDHIISVLDSRLDKLENKLTNKK